MKQLEDDNSALKRRDRDPTPDKAMVQVASGKNGEARLSPRSQADRLVSR